MSADLQWFISNKLREETDLCGSLEYELGWNEADMLLGPQICRLRASARRTSVSEYGGAPSGWRSPCAEDGDKGRNSTDSNGALHLQSQAELAGWPTPTAIEQKETPEAKVARGFNPGLNLATAASLAGWSTPTVQDAENNAGPSQYDRNSHPLNVQATLAGWASPAATTCGGTPEDHLERKRRANEAGSSIGVSVTNLEMQAQMVGWPTPRVTTNGGSGNGERAMDGHNCRLEDTVQVAPLGPTSNSSTAETKPGDESRGVLNPAFSGWLMGFPWIWTYCGLLARRSLAPRKSKAASVSSAALEMPSTPLLQSDSSDSVNDGLTENDDEDA